MKVVLFFLIMLQALFAEIPSPEAMKRADGLVHDKIPLLSLKDATFEEAVTIIKEEWKTQHPDDPLPVAVIDPPNDPDPTGIVARAEKKARITLTLRDVSFYRALVFVAEASHRTFSLKGAIPSFELLTALDQGSWDSRIYELSPEQLAGLGLTEKSSPEEATKALVAKGLKFDQPGGASLAAGTRALLVTCDTTQHVLVVGLLGRISERPSPELLKRADLLTRDRIPQFALTNASVQEAVATVQNAWDKQHPDNPLPVAIVNFGEPGDPASQPQITLTLHNVPFYQALVYIGQVSHWNFSVKRALPTFERLAGFNEPWVTRVYEISAMQLAGLGLTEKSSGDDARKALGDRGLEFEEWGHVNLSKGGEVLIMTCDVSEHRKLDAILALLEKGFKITR